MGIQRPQFFLLSVALFHTLTACLATALTNITTDQSALLAFRSQLSLDPSHILSQNWSNSFPACNWIGVTCGSRHQRVSALDISNMGLGGNLSAQLGNLSFLVSLNLRNNSFRGRLPKELAQLHRLRLLDFGFNTFTGDIPSWFGLFVELRFLILRNNSFTGSIPSSITNMSKIEGLDISYNPLQGNIPEKIGSLFNLRELLLQFNNLSGVIPASVFNISTMENLAFTGNRLSGNLPQGMCHGLPNLRGLYLSLNELDSSIPPNISECSQLSIISLSFNKFSGSIPREIGNLRALEILDLSTNHLTGTIPKEMGNLSNLEELDLSWNNLTEYGSEGLVSVRCDVYSFGIMLMEIYTRMKPNDIKFTGDLSLRRWVDDSMPNTIVQVIDSELLSAGDRYFNEKLECLVSIIEIALQCSMENPSERTINMKSVVVKLKKIMAQLLRYTR